MDPVFPSAIVSLAFNQTSRTISYCWSAGLPARSAGTILGATFDSNPNRLHRQPSDATDSCPFRPSLAGFDSECSVVGLVKGNRPLVPTPQKIDIKSAPVRRPNRPLPPERRPKAKLGAGLKPETELEAVARKCPNLRRPAQLTEDSFRKKSLRLCRTLQLLPNSRPIRRTIRSPSSKSRCHLLR